MTLKLNGYSTAQFGKCHEVPVWQSSPIGPFDAWPSGGGGFETSTASSAARTTSRTRRSTTAPRRSSRRRRRRRATTSPRTSPTTRSSWIRTQKALCPDKPFFVYFAPGATHAPHHVPQEWADKYAGQFADGWDAQRETHLRAAEGARRDPRRRRADRAARRDPGVGRHARRAQAGARARRWRSTPGSSSTPTTTSAG